MKKFNIFQVNGVWQLGRYDEQDEEDDENLPLPKDHVEGGRPQPPWCSNVNPNLGQDSKHSGNYDEHEDNTKLNMFDTCFDMVDQRMDRLK